MSSQEYENFDLPGIGEVRAREGTATADLAGAVKFWHDKYQSAISSDSNLRRDGFIGGFISSLMLAACSFGVYLLLR